MGVSVPRGAGRDAEDDGEVDVDAEACFPVDSSPELKYAANGDGRRCGRRPGDRNICVSCQDDAQDKKNTEESTRRVWRCSRRPGLQLPAGGNGDAPRWIPSRLVALGLGFGEEK